jgi:aerobic carbon-monoxide dehydrogenase small subunit
MLTLTVNRRKVNAAPEPRTHLADFLREHLNLTGTHLGCEHGVCGACTLLLDGVPARSCIAYAVACEGAEVTTIEGLDSDEITTELRAAFTREHALQCGYCTPGMLISARDLVLRLAEPCEREIRLGLSGNLCRCTGYVGIVRAVRHVIGDRRARGIAPVSGAGRDCLGPAGSHPGGASRAGEPSTAGRETASVPKSEANAGLQESDFHPAVTFDQHFTVAHPAKTVFAAFGRLNEVAMCLPGARLTGMPSPDTAEGEIRVKLGPIAARFRGTARIERSPDTLAGRMIGAGSDARSRSSTRGEIRYRLVPSDHGAATRVDLTIGYTLTGALAQFSRPGLVKDLAARLTAEFALNLERQLSGEAPIAPVELNGAALLFALLRDRVRALLSRLSLWR